MFKNFASDALGLSDIGKIIPPSQFNQTDIDDYIFHNGFILSSNKRWTNTALPTPPLSI